jgi:hypothetical protein
MAKERYSVDTPSWTGTLIRAMMLSVMTAGIVVGIPDTPQCAQNRPYEQSTTMDRTSPRNHAPAILVAAREKRRDTATTSSPPREGKDAYNKNVERWQALPSDKKKEFRKRMDEWRSLSPQEQNKYRRRYEKMQEMTPDQRKKVDQGLKKWDTLSPSEKEEIRNLFNE